MEGFNQAYGKALNYLSYRPRTVKEMNDYLTDKEYSQETIQQIIGRLIELRYLDDYEYSRRYIEVTSENKALSLELIKHHLKHKGVPTEVIKDTLDASDVDELDHCTRLLRKKVKEKEYLYNNKQTIKLKSFLFRKGFRTELIHKAIDLLKKEWNER